MNKSESIATISAALADAQAEVENAGKNAVNPHFRNRYADLAEILNTVRPVFARHGIAIVQSPSYEGGILSVETTLAHKSGEWMSSVCSCQVMKSDPQGIGSAITYMRRYALAAMTGISQEDDDGNGASHHQSPKPAPAPKPAGNGLREAYDSAVAAVGADTVSECLKSEYGVPRVRDIPNRDDQAVVAFLGGLRRTDA